MSSRIPNLVSAIVLCGCVLFFQSAYGQTAQQPPSQPASSAEQPAAPAGQQAASPASVDKELAFLLGKWETKIKIFPNPLFSNTAEVKGRGTAEYRVFGKVVEGIRSSDTSLGRYEDREFIWLDPNTKGYNIISINSDGYSINKKMRKFEDKYVVEYTGRAKAGKADKPDSGAEKEFIVRAKYKIVSDTEVKYSSEVKIGKSGFIPFMQLKMMRPSEKQ